MRNARDTLILVRSHATEMAAARAADTSYVVLDSRPPGENFYPGPVFYINIISLLWKKAILVSAVLVFTSSHLPPLVLLVTM